jgi:hypothetical protein
MAQDLSGVIDLHAHCDPDTSARSIDAIDLAKLAREQGRAPSHNRVGQKTPSRFESPP